MKTGKLPEPRDRSGVALFMVMAAISVLSILVTEFSYIAQVNERMAYDSMDQVKAFYLAKAGVKLSLLRLKAYAQLKQITGGSSGSGNGSNPLAGAVPHSVMDKVWSFPFMYPVPQLPEMSIAQKDQIDEFTKKSSLEGHYTAVIESESSKYNLNSILPGFQGAPSPSPSTGQPPNQPNQPNSNPSAAPSYNADNARKSLETYLQSMITAKSNNDDDFAREYRDYKLDDLINYIALWADRNYTTNMLYPTEGIQPKRAPFYSLTELHMVPTMDDELYNLFTDGLTVSTTNGIDINTMQQGTLSGLIPQMTPDEVSDFFKFRDDPTIDNTFKKVQDFWDYITKNVSAFRGEASEVSQVQNTLKQQGINLIVDETQFKITVQATVNQAVTTIELWVTLNGVGAAPLATASGNPAAQPSIPPLSGPGAVNPATGQTPVPDTGLVINFMRVL